MHDKCPEICPLSACNLHSELCPASDDTKFAVHRANAAEAARRLEIKAAMAGKILRYRNRPEIASLGFGKYDRRRTRGLIQR